MLNNIVKIICSHAKIDAIYLYGSRAKNTAHANSDWDIAVIFTEFESSELERLVRPQLLEAEIERELNAYQKISVIDLEIVPIYLQMAVLNHGIKCFERNSFHVKRIEQSILSKWEKDYERYCL
ncbi:MAG: nucleotidyltransferase domain-containing protein [Methylococcaceae bacterium]